MAITVRDISWLVALEATLSFSVPVWFPSGFNNPGGHTAYFFPALLAVAAACTFIFHLGPAYFASRYAPLGVQSSWMLVLLAIGCTIYSTRLLLAIDQTLLNLAPPRVTSSVFLLFVGAVAFVRSWWKPATALALLNGTAISIYMLTIPWEGHSISRFAEEPLSANLVQALFLAVAPAFAIGWQIGCLKPHRKQIWLTALLGIFLPLLLSTCISALMTQVGVSLRWHASLYQDLSYALLGPNVGHTASVWRFIFALLGLSLVGPALLCAVSVRFLSATFSTAKKITLALSAGAVIIWLFATQTKLEFTFPPDSTLTLWTVFLTSLGVGTGVACLLRRPKPRSLNDDASLGDSRLSN